MGLRVWLPFNKGSKNFGLDYAILARLTNFCEFVSGVTSPVHNGAVAFKGQNVGIMLSQKQNMTSDILGDKSAATISVWTYPYQTTSGCVFSCKPSALSFALWNNKFYLRTTKMTINGTNAKTINVPVPAAETWVHYALTFENGLAKAYVNGEFIGSATSNYDNDTLPSGMTYTIGGISSSYAYSGMVCDYRIYDNCLTEYDIKRLYNRKLMDIVATNHNYGFLYDNSGLLINKLVGSNVEYSGNTICFNTTGNNSIIRPADGISGLKISGGTLSVWFNPYCFPTTERKYETIYIDSASRNCLSFFATNNGTPYFIVTTNNYTSSNTNYNSSLFGYISTDRITCSAMNNVTITYGENKMPINCYVNGEKITPSTTKTRVWEYLSGITIGNRIYNSGTSYFIGTISKITTYGNILSESEILRLYETDAKLLEDGFLPSLRCDYIELSGNKQISFNVDETESFYFLIDLKINNIRRNGDAFATFYSSNNEILFQFQLKNDNFQNFLEFKILNDRDELQEVCRVSINYIRFGISLSLSSYEEGYIEFNHLVNDDIRLEMFKYIKRLRRIDITSSLNISFDLYGIEIRSQYNYNCYHPILNGNKEGLLDDYNNQILVEPASQPIIP